MSPKTLDLTGYRITDINGRSYDFPSMLIPPGPYCKGPSGRGRHQSDPKEQLEIYPGSSTVYLEQYPRLGIHLQWIWTA